MHCGGTAAEAAVGGPAGPAVEPDGFAWAEAGGRGNGDAATAGKASVMGAFSLYLDFYNMFLFLLRLMARPPAPGEPGPPRDEPIRTAGINPGPATEL